MDWNPQEWLKKRHTRELMALRVALYRVHGGRNRYGDPDEDIHYNPFDDHGHTFTLAQLKAELATREHVPNKKEAKAIRQQRAKERK